MTFKKLVSLATVTVLSASLLVGCSGGESEKKDDGKLKIAMVTDVAGVNDQSFNQSAWEGLEKAKKDLGVDVTYLESKQDSDYASNIETLVDQDTDLILGVGMKLAPAIEEAAKFAGARDVVLMEEPMAAAIGAGLPVGEPTGSMIVDIGGGTTEVAIISLGGIVTSKSLRVAGDELDQAIMAYIKKEFNLMIGERTAEQVKMELGSAYKTEDEEMSMEIKGRDMITGLPKTVTVTDTQIRDALKEPVYAIIESIKTTLEKTPPELAADIMEKGIMLAGGGALLRGLDELINHETNMPVHIAESPLDCVVLGAGKALDNFDELSKSQRGQ